MGRFSVYSFHNLLIQARIHQGVKKNHGIAQTNRTEMCHSFKSNLTSLHSTSRYSVYSNCESTFEQSLEHKSLSAETINRLGKYGHTLEPFCKIFKPKFFQKKRSHWVSSRLICTDASFFGGPTCIKNDFSVTEYF